MRIGGAVISALAMATACACSSWSPARLIYDRYARLDGARVVAELKVWEAAARQSEDDAGRAGALLRVALLRSHPDNPEPDFGGALAALEEYQSLDPKGGSDPEVRRLHGLLTDLRRCVLRGERRKEVVDLLWKEEQEVRRRLEALRRDSRGTAAVMELLVEEERALTRRNENLDRQAADLAARNETLLQRVGELEETARGLTQDNRELRETLERLKSLDLQMERMRSGAGGR